MQFKIQNFHFCTGTVYWYRLVSWRINFFSLLWCLCHSYDCCNRRLCLYYDSCGNCCGDCVTATMHWHCLLGMPSHAWTFWKGFHCLTHSCIGMPGQGSGGSPRLCLKTCCLLTWFQPFVLSWKRALSALFKFWKAETHWRWPGSHIATCHKLSYALGTSSGEEKLKRLWDLLVGSQLVMCVKQAWSFL